MGAVIDFSEQTRQRPPRLRHAFQDAEILLFMGVRYERWTDEPTRGADPAISAVPRNPRRRRPQ